MTIQAIPEALAERVTAHLNSIAPTRRILWTGKSSIVVHFTTDLQVVSMDTRFEPLMLNWTQTFRSPDGAIYLNVPAAWRRDSRETGEGEAEVKPMTAPMKDLLTHLAAGATIETSANVAVYPDLSRFEHFKHGTFTGLIERKYVELVTVTDSEGCEKRVWGVSDEGLTAIGLPPKSVGHNYERFNIGDHVIRKSDKVEFHVTAVDGDFISGVRWYGVEVPAGARRAIGQPDTKVSARVELIERAHRKHFTRVQDEQPAPLIDPTAPLPANEITNADEPHDDIGTGVDPEPANNLPDAQSPSGFNAFDVPASVLIEAREMQIADPYAWATPVKRAALNALLDRKHIYPQIIEPSTTEDVWRIEDEWKVKTMERTISKIGGELVGTLEQDWNGDEPYCVALFRLEVDGRPDYAPFPSKRTTKPAADPNSIHAQYDAIHNTLPGATFLLIQANGDEWLAFQMDAMLLRRYAPLCRFSPQTVNQAGEQWDKLSIPAGLLDETVTNANEGGLTVALASIVRDEPGKLPVREVDEIHAPGEPVQYVGKEEPPTEWETESDTEAQPDNFVSALIQSYFEPVPAVEAPTTAAPSEIEMTPALMAAKIKLHIHGALRLGLIESVTPMPHDGWFAVTFVHGLTEAFTVPALKTVYEVGDVWRSKRTVYVREQSTAPHGTAIEQAAAVLENLSAIGEVFADAKARMEAFTAPEPEPTTALLDHDAGADLIATLRTEHADLSEASLGITEFL